jgi:hypothetical protein
VEKNWRKLAKDVVFGILKPRFNQNSVVWLKLEAIFQVVNDENFIKAASQLRQILDSQVFLNYRVLPIQPMADKSFVWIQSI